MCVFLKFWARSSLPKAFEFLVMSANNEKVFYAVGRGREIGVFDSWKECKAQTEGFCNAKYRKFYSLEEAQEFVTFWRNYTTPSKDSIKSENLMEIEENEDTVCKGGHQQENDNPTAEREPMSTAIPSPSSHHNRTPTNSPYQHLQAQTFCSRTLHEDRISLRDVDAFAVNLRLDSFEKRFDACLKEVGALTSEISHLRSELKEVKDALKSSGLRNSPRKGNDGMMQTTLSFGPGSSSFYKNQSVLEESERKSVKRKLASDSSEGVDFSNEKFLKKFKAENVDFSTFTLDSDDFVVVYTDGSALSNGKCGARAGIGIWFGAKHPLNVAEPVDGRATSNTAEIQAARVAIQLATRAGVKKLKIRTDSEYIINCATKWIKSWKKNGWTLKSGGPVKNKKELEKLDEAAAQITVVWEKVPAHSNILGNETADRLANEGAALYGR